jgi:ribosomal protein S7
MQKTDNNKENIFGNLINNNFFQKITKSKKRNENNIKQMNKSIYKKLIAIKMIKESMEIISLITKKNPLKILLDAVNKSIIYNNVNKEIPHLKKINLGIYYIIKKAKEESLNSKKIISESLAEEIISLSKK